jgi:hypothetical protein
MSQPAEVRAIEGSFSELELIACEVDLPVDLPEEPGTCR